MMLPRCPYDGFRAGFKLAKKKDNQHCIELPFSWETHGGGSTYDQKEGAFASTDTLHRESFPAYVCVIYSNSGVVVSMWDCCIADAKRLVHWPIVR